MHCQCISVEPLQTGSSLLGQRTWIVARADRRKVGQDEGGGDVDTTLSVSEGPDNES